jgi:O-antigen ligase
MLHTFLFFCIGISLVCYVYAAWLSMHYGSLKVVGLTERNYYYFSYKYLTAPVDLDPIYVSLYVNFAILILLFRPLKNKSLSLLLLFYFLVFNVLVASKIGIIACFIIFSFYFLGRIKNKFIAVGICCIILASLAWAIKSSTFLRERFIVSTQFNYELPWAGDWNSTSQRLAIWTCAIETVGKVFPWGYGTSDAKKALNETYRSKNYIRGYEDEYNAHSEYLHALLEVGIFGFAALLLIFAWPFIQSIKTGNSLFVYFLILIFFYFFVEIVLTRRAGVIFFSFFYSLLALNGVIEQRRDQTTISDEI